MKFYKNISDGYIFAISTGRGQIEITEEEYNAILDVIYSAPTAPDGYTYLLRADTLEWELQELPPLPDPSEEEIDDAEALEILLEGVK